MRRDEGDVEAADEEARVEQPIAAVGRGFAERVTRALLLRLQRSRRVGAPRNADREQSAQRDEPGHDPERLMIADIAEQHRRERHDEELAERPARGDDAEGAAALFRADDAADRPQNDDEGGCRLRHADEDTEADMQPDRVGREGGADQPERIKQRAEKDDAPRAMLVGERADKRLHEAEEQVLERHREPEVGAADADIDAHLRQKQAERLTHAHRERDDEGGAGDNDPRALHGGELGGAHVAAMRLPSVCVKRAWLSRPLPPLSSSRA